MKPTRLVVTRIDENGRSVHKDTTIEPVVQQGAAADGGEQVGKTYTMLWGTDEAQATVGPGLDHAPTRLPFFATVGGSRFVLFTAPPFGDEPSNGESVVDIDGLTQVVSSDANGVHVTDTIDYVVVIEGEITLELDQGVRVELTSGDCVVQRGTSHSWKNYSAKRAVIAGFMIGAERTV